MLELTCFSPLTLKNGVRSKMSKIYEFKRHIDKRATPDEPVITFYMDDGRIIFRDQDALDEYVAGAILEYEKRNKD